MVGGATPRVLEAVACWPPGTDGSETTRLPFPAQPVEAEARAIAGSRPGVAEASAAVRGSRPTPAGTGAVEAILGAGRRPDPAPRPLPRGY